MSTTANMQNSTEIRAELVEALRLDLVGPDNAHAFAKELLPEPPSRWYLTGFLVPCDAPLEQRIDPTAEDEMDGADDSGANDDGVAPDRGAARRSILPSSLGVSVLVAAGVERIEAIVEWGDYIWESPDTEPAEDGTPAEAQPGEEASALVPEEPPASALKIPKGYRRDPREERVTLDLPAPGAKSKEFVVPNSGGLTLHVTVRAVTAVTTRLPAGTRSMSVFLVNRRAAHEKHRYRTFAFQATLRLKCEKPFVPRPDLRGPAGGALTEEWDEKVADSNIAMSSSMPAVTVSRRRRHAATGTAARCGRRGFRRRKSNASHPRRSAGSS